MILPDKLDFGRLTYASAGLDLSPLHAHLDAHQQDFLADALGKTEAGFAGDTIFASGTAYTIRSPIDDNLELGTFLSSTEREVDLALQIARRASRSWREVPALERASVVRSIAGQISNRRFDICSRLVLEVGKTRAEAMAEVEEAVDIVTMYSDWLADENGGVTDLLRVVPGEQTQSRMRPYGVFAVISPFNFPFALSIGMIVGALLAGNAVVWKPTEMAVLSAAAISEIIASSGLPEGLLNMVVGGASVGEYLSSHREVDGIAFTGSHAVGMRLARLMSSGDYARPFLAELGGKNATFVTSTADIEVAAAAVVRAAFAMSGQKCSACSKVYVSQNLSEEFVSELAKIAGSMTDGDPRLADTYTGSVINSAAARRYLKAVDESNTVGKVHCGGQTIKLNGLASDRFALPTVVTGLPPDHRINRDELFCPIVSVVPFSDLEAAIADSNRGMHGLTTAIYTSEPTELDTFKSQIEAGVVYANRPTSASTGAWPGYQVFSGWKGSGTTGKGALGRHYVRQFAREQSLTIQI